MHTITLSAGVASMALSLYFLLGIAYPFISLYQGTAYGWLLLLAGALLFGGFGSYLCWASILSMEEKKVGRKLHRKRRKLFTEAARR